MRFLLLFVSLFTVIMLHGQSLTFAFKGTVSNAELGKNESGVTVSIVQNGSTVGSATTATNGKYALKGNVNYKAPFSVVFSKSGMVSKKVNFNFATMNEEDIPSGAEYMPVSDLSMSVFSEKENVDFSFLNNEPVASFNWNDAKIVPELDKVAADKMKARIEKLLLQAEQNNSASDAKYQALIKEADNLYLSLKKYPEALAKYEEALALKPKEKYPSDKIVELDALIAANQKQAQAAQQSDAEYQNLIKAADALRDQKKYDQAIAKYKEASAKKNEQYPKDQIVAVQKLIDDQKKQADIDAKYNDALKAGDLAMTQKNFTLAKEKYTAAKDLKPAEQVPVTKLSEVEKKLAEQNAAADKKKKFDDALAAADKSFSEGKWAEAKTKYAEAGTLDPSAVIPPAKVKECDAKIANEAKDKEKSDKIAKALADGNTFLAGNKLNEAKGKYNEVLGLDPANTEAKQKLQEISAKQQDAAKADEEAAKFLKLVTEGDAASKALKYTEAKTKYEAALAMRTDAAVQIKLDEITKKIKDQEDKASQDAKFQALKTEGLKLANEQKYDEAKAKLTEAQSIKADAIIAAKLKEIEEKQKQNDAASKLDKDYQDLLAAAQSLESSKDYTGAIQKYKEASAKKPAEKLPKDKIASLELLKMDASKQKELDTKYDAFMKKGDELMAQQKYLDAIKEYNNALAVKPNETLPVTKAKEAEEAEKSRGSEDKKQYEKIIGGIEKAIAEKDYTRGKELVERAKSFNKQFNIFPADTRPADLLAQINMLEQADKNYAAKITEAEKFASVKEYSKAIAAYEAAKVFKPAETVPQTKIEELRKLMTDQASAQEKEQLYKEYMSKGALSQNSRNYQQSLDHYQNALGVKPDDQAAKDKIAEVKQLMDDQANASKSAQEKKEKFDALIREGDALFRTSSYTDAASKYTEALGMDGSSKYAKKQLEECNRRKSGADAAKAEEEFKALIKTADQAFDIKSFDKAKEDYNKALAIKPGNPYATNKIKEIDAFLNPATENAMKLQPLGTPYESSIMDGYAALQEAEIQRKNSKEVAVGSKVTEAVKAGDDLDQLQETKSQSNRDKVTAVIEKVATNDQNSDLNRQLTSQVFEKAQNDLANTKISDEGFKHVENVKSQEKLSVVVNESTVDYKSREGIYSENSEILTAHNTAYREGLRQQEVNEGTTSIQSGQRILLVEKGLQSDMIDDFESRAEVRQAVDSKLVEVEKVDQDLSSTKKNELLANDQQLFSSKVGITEKDVQDAKVAGTNDNYLKEVKRNVNDKDKNVSDEQLIHTTELDRSISRINTSMDENNVQRDLNRQKTTELIHDGNENVEQTTISTNKKENTKYLSNQSIINDQGAIKGETESKAKENLSQNAQGVELLDKKANTTAVDLNLSDDDERLQARSKVETISGNVQDNLVNDNKNQTGFNQKIGDATKAIDAGNAGLEESNKNKNLSNQEKLTTVESKKTEKVKLANSLGKEYPEGVSQESFTQSDQKGLMTSIITRRIVVVEGHGDVYVRTQTLQAITYTKNGQPTTEMVWQRETQGPHLQKHY